jgi:hypothetical protein
MMRTVIRSWVTMTVPGAKDQAMNRILLMFSLILSGCASVPQHLSVQKQNQINNVAIVSLVPENVNFYKIGVVPLLDEYMVFDMGGKVTSSIASVARERIARSHPGWAVKAVRYDQAALLGKVGSSDMGLSSRPATQAFADLARNNGLDAIFVVRAAPDQANNLREGLNVLFAADPLGVDQALSIRANLSVAVVDRSGEVIAQGGVPAELDTGTMLDPATLGLRDKMKDNQRPEVLDRLRIEVIADLTRRLGLCFDSLGF